MRRTERLGVRVRTVEKRLIEEAAGDRGESLSSFVRRVAVREATETVLTGKEDQQDGRTKWDC